MKKIIIILVSLIVFDMKGQNIEMQDVEFQITLPDVSLISIQPDNNTVVLAIDNAKIAGEKSVFTQNSAEHLWLNYTCSIASNNPTKNLSAQIVSGIIPDGLTLQLNISECRGGGKGQLGTPTPSIVLQYYPQIIITNIGGSYTKKGINQGHKLEYFLEITNFKTLDSEKSNTLTIMYTLTDN